METERILVVDDELVACNLLSDILKDKGYGVEYSQSPREAMQLMAESSFDVVIVDLKMPAMNGIELLGQIKHKLDPEAVVIIVTGYGSLESAQEALRLGAYDYITKPFDINKIYFIVKRAVDAKKLINANKELLRKLQEKGGQLEHRIDQRVREAEFICRIGQEIASTLDLDRVLRNIVDRLTDELALERCAILLADDASGELSIKYARGLDKQAIEQTRIKKGEKISGWVLEQNKLIYSEDVNRDPRFARRKQERYYARSLMSVPLVVDHEGIGVININSKKSGEKFIGSDIRLFREVAAQVSIGIENMRLYKSQHEIYMRTIRALASAIDAKDHYTKAHSEQVTGYAVAIAEELGLPSSEIETIKEAAQLHDLGKIGIHDYILTKSEQLTPQEWEKVKLHALKGAQILEPLGFMKGAITLIKQHHERYDGQGYPHGYKAKEIALGARIMAVADAYDAMVSERPYRKAYSKKGAIEELKKNSGTQFDPQVLKAFLKVLKKEQKP